LKAATEADALEGYAMACLITFTIRSKTTAPSVAAMIAARIPPPPCSPRLGDSADAMSAPKMPIRMSPSRPNPVPCSNWPASQPATAPIVTATSKINLLDRAYGKPPQFNTNDAGSFKRAVEMSDDELAAIAARAKLTVV
jgi:hypothetical protein